MKSSKKAPKTVERDLMKTSEIIYVRDSVEQALQLHTADVSTVIFS